MIEFPSSAENPQSFPSEPAGYGRGAQLFHWISVTLVLLLVTIGLYCAWLETGPWRAWLLDSWHKPLGLLVIMLTVGRLAWKALQPRVHQAPGLTSWEAWLSRITHWALYAILLAMPLSGLLMSEGGGRPTSFFGLFEIPQLLSLDPTLKPREQYWYKVGKSLHENWFQWSLYALIAVHVAGALKHGFVDRNPAYFRRMWNWRRMTSHQG